jgi:hypothetical protein
MNLKNPVVHERHEKARTDSDIPYDFRHMPTGKLQDKNDMFVLYLS